MTYKIPEDIKCKISEEFYSAMIWLYRYFEKLEPPESDMFDKEIEAELLRGYKNHAKLS